MYRKRAFVTWVLMKTVLERYHEGTCILNFLKASSCVSGNLTIECNFILIAFHVAAGLMSLVKYNGLDAVYKLSK